MVPRILPKNSPSLDSHIGIHSSPGAVTPFPDKNIFTYIPKKILKTILILKTNCPYLYSFSNFLELFYSSFSCILPLFSSHWPLLSITNNTKHPSSTITTILLILSTKIYYIWLEDRSWEPDRTLGKSATPTTE